MKRYKNLKINRRNYYPDTRREHLTNGEQPEFNLNPRHLEIDFAKMDFTEGQNRACYEDKIEELARLACRKQLENDLREVLKKIDMEVFLAKTKRKANQALKKIRRDRRRMTTERVRIGLLIYWSAFLTCF